MTEAAITVTETVTVTVDEEIVRVVMTGEITATIEMREGTSGMKDEIPGKTRGTEIEILETIGRNVTSEPTRTRGNMLLGGAAAHPLRDENVVGVQTALAITVEVITGLQAQIRLGMQFPIS